MGLSGGVSLAVLLLLLLGLVGRCVWAWPTSNHFPIASILFFVVVFSLFLQTSATNTEQRPLLEEVNDSVAGLAGLLNTGISYFVEIF